MKILIPMSGPETAFEQAGQRHGKWLMEIHARPLVQHVFENLQSACADSFIFVIRKEYNARYHLADVLRLMAPGCDVVVADGPTAGAACTALLAIERINPEEELLIANGDQILLADLNAILDEFRERKLDAGTIVFDSIHPRWSYVRLNTQSGLVVEATEKRPISRLATAGIYYFRRGGDFCDAASGMIRKGAHVNGAYYVCPCFNELILRQLRVGVHQISGEQYYSLATPQGVERYTQLEPGKSTPPPRVPTREILDAVAARRIPPREMRPARA